jgi:phosphoesterase RecJ-like protein
VDPKIKALKRLLSDRVLLFCHHNADPDSVCAAYAFKELAETVSPMVDVEIVLTEGVSSLSKRVIKAIGMKTIEETSFEGVDALIVIDASTLTQLGKWGEEILSADAPKVFIDHHAPHQDIVRLADVYIIDEKATSTCEVVYCLYRRFGLEPSTGAARALLVGIAYDSRHFAIGTAMTFRAVSELLEVVGDVGEVLGLLALEMNRSERIARLKAAQRVRIHDLEGWTMATSQVNSFQASAARGLISLGADVVVVAGGGRGFIKASLRSTDEFYRETSIHLGRDISASLGEEFGGAGSGHPTAAGINVKGKPRSLLQRAVELLSDIIHERDAVQGELR